MIAFLSLKFLGHFDGQCSWLQKNTKSVVLSRTCVRRRKISLLFFLLCFIGLVEFILIPVAYWEAAVGSLSVFVVEN